MILYINFMLRGIKFYPAYTFNYIESVVKTMPLLRANALSDIN